MDPATGASTCAFGSQRCSPKIGTFTRNAKRQNMGRRLVFKTSWFMEVSRVLRFCSVR